MALKKKGETLYENMFKHMIIFLLPSTRRLCDNRHLSVWMLLAKQLEKLRKIDVNELRRKRWRQIIQMQPRMIFHSEGTFTIDLQKIKANEHW